jgi:hypothetical protein
VQATEGEKGEKKSRTGERVTHQRRGTDGRARESRVALGCVKLVILVGLAELAELGEFSELAYGHHETRRARNESVGSRWRDCCCGAFFSLHAL